MATILQARNLLRPLSRQIKHSALNATRSFAIKANRVHIADKCDRHVVSSPFDPIPPGPYPPLFEFLTSEWKTGGWFDKTHIVDTATGLERTFQDHYDTAGGLAASLKYDMGVKPQDCVALYCPNHVDYLPIPLAVSLTGAMVTPINPLYSANELSTVLTKSRSSVLVVHATKVDVALEAMKGTPAEEPVKHIVVVTDGKGEAIPYGMSSLESLRSHSKAFHNTEETVETSEHPVSLPYSSGTTGMPKGVSLTHDNLVSNLLQTHGVERDHFHPAHGLASPLPFFHIYGFTVSLLYTAWQGQTLVTSSGRFDLEEFLQTVQEYKLDRAHLVPPILLGLAKNPVVDNYDLSSLRTIVSAAAPLSSDIEERISERLGGSVEVKQYWGMSELSPLATANQNANSRSGSVGPLTPSTFGKILDEEGNSLAANQSGELLIKGPQVMSGYLNEKDKTAECLSDSGWLRTGDVAHYDEEGFFYITERIKELIKVRAFQVAPAELEALLVTHKDIDDAAVIGKPDEESGELPRAYVVLKEGSDVSEKQIYQFVRDQVAPYKRLDGGIVFTDKIPKSASGKILRRLIRDEMAASEH